MKKRFLICSVLSVSFFGMKAQEKISAEVNIKTEPTEKINFNETNIGFSFHKKINTNTTITNTLIYSNMKVNYELGSFKVFENLDQLNQIQNKFNFSYTVSDKTKLKFSVTPTASFQQNLNTSDFTILGSFEFSRQLGPKTTMNIGAAKTNAFGYPKLTPVLSLGYKLNEQSNIVIGFPDSEILYSNNVRNKFIVTNSFNASKVIVSQMTSAFEYERNMDKNWFINFKAGYDFNKKYILTDDNNHKVYDFNISDGYILGIGIKYKQ
jgi:hypothetical protein